jgi:hypothetical protein
MRSEVCLQRGSSLAAASLGDGDKSAPWISELGVVSSGIAGTAPDPGLSVVQVNRSSSGTWPNSSPKRLRKCRYVSGWG